MQLNDNNCVLPNGASGIGPETAKRFGEAGAQLVIGSIDLDMAKEAANALAGVRKNAPTPLDGAVLASKAALAQICRQGVHPQKASEPNACGAARRGALGLARTIARDGGEKGVRAAVICQSFAQAPLVENKTREQATHLSPSEKVFTSKIMPGETTDESMPRTAPCLAGPPNTAWTARSIAVSHGRRMN
jgi:3-hydroxybutyrate dehydrogenase